MVAAVQGGIGILEDGLHFPAEFGPLQATQGVNVFALIEDLAAVLAVKAYHGTAAGGLAAAGFTNQGHALVFFDVEGNATDCLHGAHTSLEINFQITNFKQTHIVHLLDLGSRIVRREVPSTLKLSTVRRMHRPGYTARMGRVRM